MYGAISLLSAMFVILSFLYSAFIQNFFFSFLLCCLSFTAFHLHFCNNNKIQVLEYFVFRGRTTHPTFWDHYILYCSSA